MNTVIERGIYTRYHSIHREQAENEIKKLYDNIPERTIITTSGMNSIFIVMFSFIQYAKAHDPNPILMMADELYSDTQEDIYDYLITNNITIIHFDQSNATSTNQIIQTHKNHIYGIFLESCSNPYGKITDWSIFTLLPPHTKKIVDNTWLSPITFNPFKHNADIIVESCTKYITGSTQIMGHISLRKKGIKDFDSDPDHTICPFSQLIDTTAYTMGTHVSSHSCHLLCTTITNIKDRVNSSNHRTTLLMQKFQNHKIPTLNNIFWSGYTPEYISSIALFEITITNETMKSEEEFEWRHHCEDTIKNTQIAWETSYGKKYDTICNWVNKTPDNKHILLRLSLGHYIDDEDKITNVDRLYDDILYIISNM